MKYIFLLVKKSRIFANNALRNFPCFSASIKMGLKEETEEDTVENGAVLGYVFKVTRYKTDMGKDVAVRLQKPRKIG